MSFAILSVNAQEKENEVKEENRLSAYAEVTAYDFEQYNYTLDINYRISDRVSLSSWNTITSGRTVQQGYNYSVVSGLLNFKSKNLDNTLSIGYSRTEQYSFNFINKQFVVKLRVKLL
tara:strand:- start:25 stop:378 length:354 start_codon:yes stop_codon:yes gene_type:complete